MNEAIVRSTFLVPAVRGQLVRSHAQRGAAFGVAWILVGMAVGFLGRESVGPGAVATISNMIAGALLLPILGIPTMFCGGRAWDALLGAATAGIAMQMARIFGAEPPTAQFQAAGVIMGALMANTAWPIVRKVRALVRGSVATA